MSKDLIHISKKVMQRNGYNSPISELMNESSPFGITKRTNIIFGSNRQHFDTEDSLCIQGMSVNEDYLFSIFYDLNDVNFTYLIDYIGNEFYIYFTDECAIQAYSLYMYMSGLYELKDYNSRATGELLNVVGKNFKDIPRYIQRLFSNRKCAFKEIGINKLEEEEKNYLFDFLNVSY